VSKYIHIDASDGVTNPSGHEYIDTRDWRNRNIHCITAYLGWSLSDFNAGIGGNPNIIDFDLVIGKTDVSSQRNIANNANWDIYINYFYDGGITIDVDNTDTRPWTIFFMAYALDELIQTPDLSFTI
jgi:hypothetical protein